MKAYAEVGDDEGSFNLSGLGKERYGHPTDPVILVLTRAELSMLYALARAGIDEVPEGEFSSRLPGEKDDARKIRDRLSELLNALPIEI